MFPSYYCERVGMKMVCFKCLYFCFVIEILNVSAEKQIYVQSEKLSTPVNTMENQNIFQ